jgi:gliding motility-associated-like protein
MGRVRDILRAAMLVGCVLAALPLHAQPHFSPKQIDSLFAAEGLAALPDGGCFVAGLRATCAQILRLDAAGTLRWARQICPLNENADINFGALQIAPASDGCYLLFRKGSFSSAPDNLLTMMKFDANGGFLWECALPPFLRYGTFSAGNQMSVAPDGSVWAAHGLGYTPPLPYFNQILLFKVSPAGQVSSRRTYLAEVPSTAHGVLAQPDGGAFVHGGLGESVGDGFLLRLDAAGAVLWARRYEGLHLARDGGQFANGDLLLQGEYAQRAALVRIRPDGALVWAKRLADGSRLSHCAVATDQSVLAFAAPDSVGAPLRLFKIAPDGGHVEWSKTYERCTRYFVSESRAAPDGGLFFAQNPDLGYAHTWLSKVDSAGLLPSDCAALEAEKPPVEDFAVALQALSFAVQTHNLPAPQKAFSATEVSARVSDLCPSEYPRAHFDLPDSACARSPLRLENTGNANATTWAWQLPAATPPSAQSAVVEEVVYEEAGVYPISLVQTFGVCADTLRDTIRVVAALENELFDFSDTTICPDAPFVVRPARGDFDAWLWENGSEQPERVFDTLRAGIVRLTAWRGLCSVADSFFVRLGKCATTGIFAPNVFSPNGDNQNDVWEISLRTEFSPVFCAIYDRWGNLCHRSAAGEMPRWDGRLAGAAMPPGVYLWVLKTRDWAGQEAFWRGDVTLLR